MKPLAVLSLLAAAGIVRAEVEIFPTPFGKDRYAETLAKSPFVIETKVVEEPKVEKVNPFKDLYLRGIGKADGKDYVLIQRLGEDKAMRFFGNELEAGHDELLVKTVKIGSNFRETKVMMQKGMETGEIGFKEEAITAAPPAPPRPNVANPQFGRPGVPMTPTAMPGSVRPAQPISAPPIPRPQTPTAVPLPKPKSPGNVPQPASDPNRRQRVRVINQ